MYEILKDRQKKVCFNGCYYLCNLIILYLKPFMLLSKLIAVNSVK